MKKIVYLAPLALLGVGAKASANQAPTHISNALRIYEQENKQSQPVGQNKNEQSNYLNPASPNGQNQLIGKVKENIHISRLDDSSIKETGSVENVQASQMMKISRAAIPTKQELNESKDSVVGQYVQVQQNRVAQFNKGSKIYDLNNSGQLSKNNGDGYVITNAGTYNGREVDIAVTTNGVSEQQGIYTTEWSNGDKADVTGRTDASFKYDNSVLPGTQQDAITVPNKTRNRTENKTITKHVDGYWGIYYSLTNHTESDTDGNHPTFSDDWIIDPQLLADVMAQHPEDSETDAINRILLTGIVNDTQSGLTGAIMNTVSKLGKDEGKHYDKAHYDYLKGLTQLPVDKEADFDAGNATSGWYTGDVYVYHSQIKSGQTEFAFKALGNAADYERTITEYNKQKFPDLEPIVNGYSDDVWQLGKLQITKYSPYKNATLSPNGATGSFVQPVQVTDHLQTIKDKDASLNYNYTIGVYDAQTGELIKDLTVNYKGKTGKTATDRDKAMNDAVKAKIQAINANTANAAYTGTAANDDVTFSKNTVHVNYVDTRGKSINVPGYDIDVDNLTSSNYQVPQNYVLVNTNGFKVTKNTHEVNGITVTDSYNFIDQGNNKVTDNGKTLSVVLKHDTKNVDPIHSNLNNDATNNAFIINNGAKRQINSQSRHFAAAGVLDLVTNKITKQGDWQLFGKSNFDQTNINNDLVGYGNAIHSNLTFLTL